MTYISEYTINELQAHFDGDPILGPAISTLSNLRDWTNNNSDGWAYWPKPSHAATKLQDLLEAAYARDVTGRGEAITAEDVKKAYTPIKAFLTRQVRAGQVVTPGIVEEPVSAVTARCLSVTEALGDLAAKAWARHPNNPDAKPAGAPKIRLAKVAKASTSLEAIAAYLPSAYSVSDTDFDYWLVYGFDVAGWTLDGYVIPRLASGLIFAEEVTAG